MSQELADSVDALTAQTTALLQEYVTANTGLQENAQKASDSAESASDHADRAQSSAGESEAFSIQAGAHANETKQFRDDAAAIVTGGTATVEPEPGKIPLADASGKIDPRWLSAAAYLRSESDLIADREAMQREYAGSGMLHAGKHADRSNAVTVNEGMWAINNQSSFANKIIVGRPFGADSGGTSKTHYAEFNLSGVSIALKGIGRDVEDEFHFSLPPAPQGTEVYDASTGEHINYETDLDPRYGNVALTRDEAVLRAHEGLVKNGFFQYGLDGWSQDTLLKRAEVIDGALLIEDYQSSGDSYIHQWMDIPDGTEFVFEVDIEELQPGCTFYAEMAYAGASAHDYLRVSEAGVHTKTFKVPENSGDKIQLRIRDDNNTGGTMVINSITLTPVSRSVVTHPVDLVALEIYLREINTDDPILYPYGMQQCALTQVDGISTVVNDFRPRSHFDAYPGQGAPAGRGFNILNGSLSEEQLAQIFQNKKHKVYRLSDGKIVQWTVSQRTIRGAGNGDWQNLQSNAVTGVRYSTFSSGLVTARGQLDSPSPSAYYDNESNGYNTLPEVGMFTSRSAQDLGVAVNGECYLYVLSTVPRLNQGVWHPTKNPHGTATATVPESINPSSKVATNLQQQMIALAHYRTAAYLFKTGNTYGQEFVPGRYVDTGSVNEPSNYNAIRPDGKLHDIIFGGGVGGVIDWRKPAYPSSVIDDAKVLEKCKNSSYRGLEKLKQARLTRGNESGRNGNTFGVYTTSSRVQVYGNDTLGRSYTSFLKVGDVIYLYHSGLNEVVKAIVFNVASDNVWCQYVENSASQWGFATAMASTSELYILALESAGISVSGTFKMMDVVASIESIINSPLLSEGWLGGFVHVAPNGNYSSFPLSRPASAPAITYARSNNYGTTWVIGPVTLSSTDTELNQYSATLAEGSICLLFYDVWAAITRPSSARMPMLGGPTCNLGVFVSCDSKDMNGRNLLASMINKVCSSNSSGVQYDHLSVLSCNSSGNSGVIRNVPGPSHAKVPLGAPNNSSIAGKVLTYPIAKDGVRTLQFQWNELRFVGNDWGDSNVMTIVDGISSYTDLNNNTLLCGCSELAIPYGFIDNRARAGFQTKGVDL
ncbi:hypothetical protein [Vibrio sp. ABG19]|uniref:hypothetical protein n=1 Tax=Vibrio sp. ABG19 TaxID=2817385 RepID=UPI00249DA2C0|nr:hypothetical protein [Vibrio sp. ABG19]WGY45228.1 hypothetical protein J0X00_05910 [Vibrio sp. ABG19]